MTHTSRTFAVNRPFLAFVALAAWMITPTALAGPLTLTVQGTAFGASFDEVVDVSNGFSGLTIPLADRPIATFSGFREPDVGGSGSLSDAFSVTATLAGLSAAPATLNLSGPIALIYGRPSMATDLNGTTLGADPVGTMFTPSGLASPLPTWFTGLSAAVIGSLSGGSENLVQASLALSPGVAPLPVPEPSGLVMFACGIAAIALARKRL